MRRDAKVKRAESLNKKGHRTVLRRRPNPPSAAAYLVAHACFECRRSFKLAPRGSTPKCPRCGGRLYHMGRSFRAPRSTATEQWEKVRRLVAAGFRFFSYRSHDCPRLPERLRDVGAFIAANPRHPFRVAPPDPELLPQTKRPANKPLERAGVNRRDDSSLAGAGRSAPSR
jgi:DNA-directed RNA polymerase subunit RPC12/RpoP